MIGQFDILKLLLSRQYNNYLFLFLGMNAKLAQMNALHMERKTYDEPSPQMASLPPPPTTQAHQHYLKQIQRQYTESMGKPDIMRDSDEPLDLGKERRRNESINDMDLEKTHHENNIDKGGRYYGKEYPDEDRSRLRMTSETEHSGQDDADFSEDENKTTATS